MPVTTVRYRKLVPASVAPEAVHGVGQIDKRQVSVEREVRVVRAADVFMRKNSLLFHC